MCGIAGFYTSKSNFLKDKEKNTSILKAMHMSLAHRGHDNFGIYLKEHIALSHARLSIRDISGGNQPMTAYYNKNEYAICYNGEIYNTDELVRELRQKGCKLETSSDTEVILKCFIYFGPQFVCKLNGIFAFAIYDKKNDLLYLYRDRVGVKPLFWSQKKDVLAFASEEKAIFCHQDFTPSIAIDELRELLSIGPAKTMGKGHFKNINEVLPGHYLAIKNGNIKDHTYWDLQCHPHRDSYKTTVEKVRYLLIDSVQRQMVSDVPVCSFLSGGIDSSIVTAIAYNYLKKQNKTLNTFSFDFSENDKYFKSNSFQPERDLPYIRIMLDHFPTNHTYLECNEKNLFDSLFPSVLSKDAPGMADVDASLLYFCSLVAKKNKVALTGECADEIFGGYPWFYRPELTSLNDFPWSHDINARTAFLKQEWIERLDLYNYSHETYLTSISHAPLLDIENNQEKKRRQIAYLNIKWFMQTLLDRMDRTSMYSSLEARVPFADHRIIEYVFNVPWEMKYQNGVEKALLRDAVKDILPDKLLTRKKSPYPKTYHPGYEKLLSKKFIDIVKNPSSPINALIDREKASNFLQSPTDYGRPWFGQLMAGPQLLAYYIQLNHWMETYKLTLP